MSEQDIFISPEWQRWIQILVRAVETPRDIAPEQVPSVPYTHILMDAPRLLGRTSTGNGAAEQITVTAPLALSAGVLSLSGLPSLYVVGDLLQANSSTTLARLEDVSVGSYLRSGGVGALVAWSTLKLPDAASSGDILKASSADTYASVAPAALTKTDDTNVTLTLGGTPASALVNAASLTLGWTGTLSVARGGTGTGTAFTAGSVVFAGASGVYAQDNAHLFWDDTNDSLGIGTNTPIRALTVSDGTGTPIAAINPSGVQFALTGSTKSGSISGIVANNTIAHFPALYFRSIRARGTLAVPTIVQDDDLVMLLEGEGYTGTARSQINNIGFFVESAAAMSGYINFLTAPTTASGAVERVRITGTGAVGIGTTTPTQARLQVKSTGATSATNALVLEDSAAVDTFVVRDDGAAAVGKVSLSLTTNTAYSNLFLGADFSGTQTITNGSGGTITAAVAGLGNEVRFAGTNDFGNALGGRFVAGCTNTNVNNVITGMECVTAIQSAGGRANTLLGASLRATTNDASGGTFATVAAVKATAAVSNAGATATNLYGVFVSDFTIGGTATNTYGVYIGDVTAGTQTNAAFGLYSSDANALNHFAGKVGAGVTAPTAVLHLKAGTATANTAPLKFNSGTLLTTAEAGAIEFLTDAYYGTITTGAARKTFAFLESPAFTTPNIGAASGTSLALTGAVGTYRNVTTAGWGVPAIYGSGRSTAQVAAVASVAAYTCGASDGSFIVSMNVNVTTSTVHNFTAECAYTDETNTSRVLTVTFSQLGGAFVTAITNVTGAGPYEGVPLHIRVKASTAITLSTQAAGTYTTVTYNVEGLISQVA